MKTFKEYLIERKLYNKDVEAANFKVSSFRHSHFTPDLSIVPSIHAGSQAHIYRPSWTKDNWADLHNKIADHIKNNSIGSGQHIFYSRLKQQGYYGVYDAPKKFLKVVTVLEPGKSRTVDDETEKHIIESLNIETHFID